VPLRVAIIAGSTRPGRKADTVAPPQAGTWRSSRYPAPPGSGTCSPLMSWVRTSQLTTDNRPRGKRDLLRHQVPQQRRSQREQACR